MKLVQFKELKLVVESVESDSGLFVVSLDKNDDSKYNLHFFRRATLKTLYHEKRYTVATQRGSVKSYSSLDTVSSEIIKLGGCRFVVDFSDEIK
ncbi:MAG: hypothetical protein IE883_04280 [Epsilonproteobacteria bacterium]|nr:hypothetical protein [Campylobacterota bacterium]